MPTTTAAETSSIVIRDARGQAEMRAVEELQKEVWGLPDLDVVPLSQLVAATAAGGVLLGAFDRETLVGFVYGFVGYNTGGRRIIRICLPSSRAFAIIISVKSSNWRSASACWRRASIR